MDGHIPKCALSLFIPSSISICACIDERHRAHIAPAPLRISPRHAAEPFQLASACDTHMPAPIGPILILSLSIPSRGSLLCAYWRLQPLTDHISQLFAWTQPAVVLIAAECRLDRHQSHPLGHQPRDTCGDRPSCSRGGGDWLKSAIVIHWSPSIALRTYCGLRTAPKLGASPPVVTLPPFCCVFATGATLIGSDAHRLSMLIVLSPFARVLTCRYFPGRRVSGI